MFELLSESDYQLGRAAGTRLRMAMMCVTSLATASKACQNGPKSCKAKWRGAHRITCSHWTSVNIPQRRILETGIGVHMNASISQLRDVWTKHLRETGTVTTSEPLRSSEPPLSSTTPRAHPARRRPPVIFSVERYRLAAICKA